MVVQFDIITREVVFLSLLNNLSLSDWAGVLYLLGAPAFSLQ